MCRGIVFIESNMQTIKVRLSFSFFFFFSLSKNSKRLQYICLCPSEVAAYGDLHRAPSPFFLCTALRKCSTPHSAGSSHKGGVAWRWSQSNRLHSLSFSVSHHVSSLTLYFSSLECLETLLDSTDQDHNTIQKLNLTLNTIQ